MDLETCVSMGGPDILLVHCTVIWAKDEVFPHQNVLGQTSKDFEYSSNTASMV